MSRRHSGLYTALRAGERVARQVAAAQRRQAAATARAQREAVRAALLQRAMERQRHVGNRQAQVEQLNRDLADQLEELGGLLSSGLASAQPLSFDDLKHEPDKTPFDPGKLGQSVPAP